MTPNTTPTAIAALTRLSSRAASALRFFFRISALRLSLVAS
jgi:hypothetical protein